MKYHNNRDSQISCITLFQLASASSSRTLSTQAVTITNKTELCYIFRRLQEGEQIIIA